MSAPHADPGSAAVNASSGFSRPSLAVVSEAENTLFFPDQGAGASGSVRNIKKLIGVNGFKPRGESASDPFMVLFRQASFDASVRNSDGRLPLALRRAATLKTIQCKTFRPEPPKPPEPAAELCFEAGDESATRIAPGSPTLSAAWGRLRAEVVTDAAGPRPALSTPAARGAAPLLTPTPRSSSRRPTTAQAPSSASLQSAQGGASARAPKPSPLTPRKGSDHAPRIPRFVLRREALSILLSLADTTSPGAL
ncbi:hypothetical protein T484DRAFT_1794003 [Baffinella frigidus]|nr:hypothetical protein T484DRAFT_1794003 [Cryptophyta sp. CCMP2293]